MLVFFGGGARDGQGTPCLIIILLPAVLQVIFFKRREFGGNFPLF